MKDIREIVDLFEEHERRISELYAAYADKFPEERRFWGDLSAEESGHAAWVRTLYNVLSRSDLIYPESRFNAAALKTSTAYLNSQIERARTGDMTLKQAAGVAIDLEGSMIEKRFFEAVDGDAPELKKMLDYLEAETIAHRENLYEHFRSILGSPAS